MDKSILNEVNEIKYLFNYNRSKTINEQQETPVPTPAATTGSTQTPVPTPAATTGSTQTPVPTPAAQVNNVKQGGPNDQYQYKFEDDGNVQKYYYAKKGQNDWKQSTNPKSVEAIKRNVFKIR
jgi:hypothetical protein